MNFNTIIQTALIRSGHHAVGDWVMARLPNDTTIDVLDFENMYISTVKDITHRVAGKPLHLVVLRDVRNWTASYYKWALERKLDLNAAYPPFSILLDIWVEHQAAQDVFKVLYNKWFASEGYRHKILHTLGLPCTDLSLPQVTTQGGGSSFDGLRYKHTPHNMQVLDRHLQYTDHPGYQNLLMADGGKALKISDSMEWT